jgi:4-amino-4-deoxychorismate lyase
MESALREGGREPGLKLIETMHWNGFAVRHLALHLARLHAGAEALGWPAPDPACLNLHRGPPARLRLTASHSPCAVACGGGDVARGAGGGTAGLG